MGETEIFVLSDSHLLAVGTSRYAPCDGDAAARKEKEIVARPSFMGDGFGVRLPRHLVPGHCGQVPNLGEPEMRTSNLRMWSVAIKCCRGVGIK